MFKLVRLLLPAVLLVLAAGPVRAANDGQEELDKATDAKLNATTISDLGDVIRLTESALQKGLDEGNTEFARKLLASTLMQRAHATVRQIAVGVRSPDDLRQKRQFALSDLAKAVNSDPKQPQAYLLIAQLHLLPGGDIKQSREAVDKALDLGFDEPPAHAKALLLRAGLQEQPEKKLADLDEAVRLAPDDENAFRLRGRLLADLNKLEPALADIDKAIELDPEDGPTYAHKAIVLARLKKFDEALAALDKALAIDPNNVAVLLMRAGMHQEKGDKDKALADVDAALKARPDLPVAIRTRAVLLAERERLDEAVVELERLHKLDPNDTLALLQLAMLYGAQKKPAKAIETYTRLLAEEPDEWRGWRGRGDTYLNIGKQAEAIADYEKAIKLQPKDHGILNNLAWVLATSPDEKLRNGPQAVELATAACEVSEYKLAHILSTLAAAYAETGDFDTAIKWSTKAVEITGKEHEDALKKELESYKAKKPWRERLSEEKPAETEGAADKGEKTKDSLNP